MDESLSMDSFLAAYEDDIRALALTIEDYCRVRGYAEPREYISVAASLAGEAIWDWLELDESAENKAQGHTLDSPELGDYLMAGQKSLKDVPYDASALGPLRSLLEREDFPLRDGPELLAFAISYKGRHFSPEERLLFPTPSEQEMPRLPPLKAAADLRPNILFLAESIEGEEAKEARYMLSIAALAHLMNKYCGDPAPSVAVAIAGQTLLAVAKTVPFRDKPQTPSFLLSQKYAVQGPVQ